MRQRRRERWYAAVALTRIRSILAARLGDAHPRLGRLHGHGGLGGNRRLRRNARRKAEIIERGLHLRIRGTIGRIAGRGSVDAALLTILRRLIHHDPADHTARQRIAEIRLRRLRRPEGQRHTEPRADRTTAPLRAEDPKMRWETV